MRKKILSLSVALALCLGLMPRLALAAEALPYQDVAGDAWYADAVRYAYETGIMTGTGEATFSPDAPTTRATIVTLLHRSEGTPEAEGMDFSDVAADTWYTAAVDWASANGIVNGFADGTFRPDDLLTREQFATILYRYAGYKELDVSDKGDLDHFSDADTVGDYAKDAVAWAVKVGLISGSDNGLLMPAAAATRAQAAAILMRYQTQVAVVPDTTPTNTPAPTATAKPTAKPSTGGSGGSGGGGGGGGGGTGGSTPTPTPTPTPASFSMTVQKNGQPLAEGETVAVDDVLSYAVTPAAATCDARWSVTSYTYTNGDDVEVITAADYQRYQTYNKAGATYQISADTRVVEAGTYTVADADAGGTINLTVTGKGSYSGTKTASVEVDLPEPEIEDQKNGYDIEWYVDNDEMWGYGLFAIITTPEDADPDIYYAIHLYNSKTDAGETPYFGYKRNTIAPPLGYTKEAAYDRVRLYQAETAPDGGFYYSPDDPPLADWKLPKKIVVREDAFDFPYPDVSVEVQKEDSGYVILFHGLSFESYYYELVMKSNWKISFYGDRLSGGHAKDVIGAGRNLRAVQITEGDTAFTIARSKAILIDIPAPEELVSSATDTTP